MPPRPRPTRPTPTSSRRQRSSKRYSPSSQTIPEWRTTSSIATTRRRSRAAPFLRHTATRKSRRRRLMRFICRATSSRDWDCGKSPSTRTVCPRTPASHTAQKRERRASGIRLFIRSTISSTPTSRQAAMSPRSAWPTRQRRFTRRTPRAFRPPMPSPPFRRAQGKNQEALILLRSATDLEGSMDKPPVPPAPVVPTRELLGELLLELNQPTEALREFEGTLMAEPNRFRSLFGAAQAAERSRDTDKARALYAKLVSLCDRADTQGPELQQAKAYLTK